MKRESITKADQLHVFDRDNWTCKYCGVPVFFSPTLKLLENLSPGHGYYHQHGKRGEMLRLFQMRNQCGALLDPEDYEAFILNCTGHYPVDSSLTQF